LAVFSGDGNNSGANSGCTSEPVTITAPHVSQITPTNTTCQQFQSGTAGTLSSIQYSLKGKTGSQTINQVNPGVFFYWVNVTTKTSGPPYTITQTLSADTLTTKFLLASGSFAYDANCNVIKNATITQGSNGTVTVNGSGIVFIGLKYSTSAVVGKAAPNPATVTYTFNTTQVPSSSRSIDLVKK